MKLVFDADLRRYNSFAVAARAACLAEIGDVRELERAVSLAESRNMPLLPLGEGSNVLFVGDFPGMALLMRNRGIEFDQDRCEVRVAAGENWHELVRACLAKGLHGIENLALIPGSAGAAPVQNIGAYGVELERFFLELECFDCASGTLRTWSRAQCGFAYRASALQQVRQQPRIVCSMRLRLEREAAPVLHYPALAEEFDGSTEVTPQQLFDAVCRIRRSKLPDPALLGNAGSFFKNPVLSLAAFDELRQRFASPPGFPVEGGVKLPAGWLLDQCGFRGHVHGGAAVHDRHAVVLVNKNRASGRELLDLARKMQARTLAEFGIALEPEVRIIGAEQP